MSKDIYTHKTARSVLTELYWYFECLNDNEVISVNPLQEKYNVGHYGRKIISMSGAQLSNKDCKQILEDIAIDLKDKE